MATVLRQVRTTAKVTGPPPVPIRVYGRRCPHGRASTWARVSTVASAATILHRGDLVIEADGARWRVTGFRSGKAILKPEA